MVIINNNETDQTIKSERFAESIDNKTTGVDIITRKTVDLKSNIIVPKQCALILELN